MRSRARTLLTTGLGALTIAALAAVPLVPAHANSHTVVNARINARWSAVVDSAGQTWSARSGFVGALGRSDNLKDKPIAGTNDDILYQSNVWGMTGFKRAVPNGNYQVRLLMAEDYHSAPGKRVFNVLSEGKLALQNIDIFAAVGAQATAYERIFTTTVADGSLDLSFVARVNRPLVSAIEIIQVPTAGGPGYTPPITPTGPTVGLLATNPDVSGGGEQPVSGNGMLRFAAGAGNSRSEVFWGNSVEGRFRLSRGTTVTTTFQMRHSFSDPATGTKPNPSTWHTLYQLHGPTLKNAWPSPPITIAWQDGTYRVGGGVNVPTSTGGQVNHGTWYQPYAPAPENQWRTFKVETFLDGPGRGWVSVWIDGEPYLQRWKPRAGTMYTDSGAYSHKEISVKSGLYTGTNSPTWSRWVEQRSLTMTIASPTGTRTAVFN